MNHRDIAALMAGIAPVVQDHVRACVEKAVVPFQQKIADLEKKLAEIPAPQNGKDADPELIARMIEEAVSKCPPAAPGKDADPAVVAALVTEEVRKAISALPPAAPGKDADPEVIARMVQEAVAKREMEVSQGFKQYGERVKAYEAIDKVLAPLEGALQQHGLTKAQYVERLRAAEVALESNPVQGIQWLAKQYNIDLAQIVNGQPQGQSDPNIARLEQELSQLRQWQQQTLQSSQQAVETEAVSEIEKFRADPKNEFFDQVRDEMAYQMASAAQAKRPLSLDQAYRIACSANPEISQIMSARQADAIQKRLQEQATAKVAKAAPAAGVKGNGSITQVPTGTWEDTLRDVTKTLLRA